MLGNKKLLKTFTFILWLAKHANTLRVYFYIMVIVFVITMLTGREFILALGEIYRVVVILEASAKIFKPWIISCWSNIDILLEECHTLWSTSGFEEALMSVSESSSSDDASLMNSIKYISGLDAFALQNSVFTHESLCRLSILSVGAVPGRQTSLKWDV